jgi:hypothetical protein
MHFQMPCIAQWCTQATHNSRVHEQIDTERGYLPTAGSEIGVGID